MVPSPTRTLFTGGAAPQRHWSTDRCHWSLMRVGRRRGGPGLHGGLPRQLGGHMQPTMYWAAVAVIAADAGPRQCKLVRPQVS